MSEADVRGQADGAAQYANYAAPEDVGCEGGFEGRDKEADGRYKTSAADVPIFNKLSNKSGPEKFNQI